jgi:RNA polymerase sigma-70 factor, ECF subfamily
MATYELKSASLQRTAGADAANNALHVFPARRRNAGAIFCDSADQGCQNQAWLRAEELQSAAFLAMFEACRPRFLALARAILRNAEDAEDAVHNAFLSGYRNFRRFEGRSALTTWFTRIVVNAALMVQRKRRPSRVVQFPESVASHEFDWTERIVSSQPDPDMVHGERETLQLIHERLSQMNPLLRQAFRMIHFEELSIGEACARLGLPSSTFKARLWRARRQLSNQLRRVQVAPIHRTKFPARAMRPPFVEASPS